MDPIPPAPPTLTRTVLRRLFAPEDRDCAVSDLDEEFEARATRDGPLAARRWYRDQARRSIGPALRRRLMASPPAFRIDVASDLQWAWRGVRARRERAVFVVGLLAIALTANAAMFSVADSLLFNVRPFPDGDRIVSIRGRLSPEQPPAPNTQTRLFHAWSSQHDVFSAVGSYMVKNIFLIGPDASERIPTADVTTKMLDVLGVKPRWGRGFADADLLDEGSFAALIREDLARQRFGSPQAALGKRLEATGRPLVVVGVMPDEFAFPIATYRIWRLFEPGGPLTQNHGWSQLGRLAAGLPIDQAMARVTERAPVVGQTAAVPGYTAEAVPRFRTPTPSERRTLLLLLVGAAICLLVVACANATSVELAAAVPRARMSAVQVALGASRAQLVRVSALEGLILTVVSLASGLFLGWFLIPRLVESLPDGLRFSTQNPISLDWRVVAFTTLLAISVWLLAFLVPATAASRTNLVSLLKTEERFSAGSAASGRLRRWLTVAEVAVTVVLISGGMLYARSYQRLLAVEKGFDSYGLAEVSLSMPANFFGAENPRGQFADRFIAALSAVPGVKGVTNSTAPPSMGDSGSPVTIRVDGRATGQAVMLGRKHVDANFFTVIGLPLKRGRFLQPTDPDTHIVVGEAFARRFWPDGDAIDHTIQGDEKNPFSLAPLRIVGVVGDFRTAATRLPDPTDERMYVYSRVFASSRPRTTAAPDNPPPIDTGGSFSVMTLTVRLDSANRLPAVLAATRKFEPRLEATATMIDDLYADQNATTRLAGEVVGAFSALAFLIAIAGVYGVMAFLVAARKREIGIRMALGAGRRDITRLVFNSSVRLILAGAAIGIVATLVASRWIQAQLFGITPADPLTWSVVVAAVGIVSVLGTWHPANQAARLDPAITLRTE
jgi:predicted permease